MSQNKWVVQWIDHGSLTVSVRSFDSFDEARSFASEKRTTALFVFDPLLMIGGSATP